MGDARKIVFSRVYLKALKLRSKSICNIMSGKCLFESYYKRLFRLFAQPPIPCTHHKYLTAHLPFVPMPSQHPSLPTHPSYASLNPPQVSCTARTFRWSYHGKVHLLPPHRRLIGRPELRCQWARQMQVGCGARVINIQLHKNDFGPEKTAGSI